MPGLDIVYYKGRKKMQIINQNNGKRGYQTR